ncbi:hypothetical protein [Enterococcus faecalis]|nr:hypothetical protein [Enterococcus faecalis]
MKKHPNMDTLIALGTSIAFLYGTFATIQIIFGNYLYTGYYQQNAQNIR